MTNKKHTDTQKHEALERKVQLAKQELDHSWQDLRRDGITALVGVASVYVGYRVARWLWGSKKNKTSKKDKEPEIRYVEVREAKKGNSWANMLLSRAGSIIVDIVLEKVQDNLPLTSKKDKSND